MNAELKFTPSARDAIFASWHALRLRPMFLTVAFAFFVVLPWCGAILELRARVAIHAVEMLAVLPVLAILGFGMGIPLLVYAASRRSPAAGSVVCRITDDGVTNAGPGWERPIRWSVVTDCSEWQGGLLLRSGAQAVLYLPARCVTPELVGWIRGRVRDERDGAGSPGA